MQKKPPEIVAAVDLGSNSFHMIVCSLNEGKLITLDQLKEMVRLASGLDKNNILDLETQQRALACLERFGQRIRNFPPESVRVVGTNTLRAAKNAAQFLVKAEQALNHPIHIISGIEEARLIYQGVAFSLGSPGNLRLVMDIGGGSTEYIIGSGENPQSKESLHMGCVSVSNNFFPDGKLSKDAFNKAVLFAEQQLEPIEIRFQRSNWDVAIGASGSLKAIAKVLEAKNWSNNGITRSGLELLANHLTQCTHISELNLPDFDEERLPVFPGGLAIAYATFKSLNIEQMTISDGALREGLIQYLLGRIYDQDIRATTIQNTAERYHTDRQHAARIKQTVHYILENATTQWSFAADEDGHQFLDWAADLHEIGQDIAHSQYHKHSAYIIENSDLAGFSKQDQIVLAAIIRSHRRKFSFARFVNLPAPWHQYAAYLTLVLRLAVLLRRNRHDEALPEFKINLGKSKMALKFPSGWLARVPLTHADLAQEAEYLKDAGFTLTFS
ncbi:MAG: exopolyphosphatase [Methylovulum sp.]|nr:exopolyphosphatase [Methylovulum sp.]